MTPKPYLVAIAILASVRCASAAAPFDPFAAVGISSSAGDAVPLDTVFRDEGGRTVRLGAYFGHRPVIVAPVYYTCPNVCGTTLSRLFGALASIPLVSGQDFAVVAISIDPREGPTDALAARTQALQRIGAGLHGVHFLTGDENAIAAVTGALGFRYRWDPDIRQYAHAAAIAVLTPRGRIGRWLYGFSYQPSDLRLALAEAADGRSRSITDQILLLCYHYDPVTGRYSGLIWGLLRGGGILTALALAGFASLSIWRERRSRTGAKGRRS